MEDIYYWTRFIIFFLFLGIKDITSINLETSLGELGMDSLMGVELKQFLERDFELVLSIPELRQLKIKDLKKLEEGGEGGEDKSSADKPSDIETPAIENIPGHFNSLPSKELVPSETIVHMNSVKTGAPLFIVHPIEGTVVMLSSLAQLLPCPVYGIQCTPEAPSDSIEDLAAWYWKVCAEDFTFELVFFIYVLMGGKVLLGLQGDREIVKKIP